MKLSSFVRRFLRAPFSSGPLLLSGMALVIAAPTAAQTYDYVVPVTQRVVDNAALGLAPGAVIGIDAGERGTLVIKNFSGTASQPFIFKNKGGKVRMKSLLSEAVVDILNCKFFQFRGDGSAGIKYGIEIYESYGPFGLGVGALSTNFELCFIEIHHNFRFSGIAAKTDPTTDPATQRPNFVQYDTRIHDCYIHDVTGEGLYIGNSFYVQGSPPDDLPPHELHGVRIYNNVFERCGRESIQLGCATQDVEVYNNIAIDSGTARLANQQSGVQLGSGTTGKFFNNIIIGAPAAGLVMSVIGNNSIYNNVIAEAGKNGIYFNDDAATIPGSYVRIYNNTITTQDPAQLPAGSPSTNGFQCDSPVTVNEFINNAVVVRNPGASMVLAGSGVTVTQSNNVLRNTSADFAFANEALGDYRIGASSVALNVGANLSSSGVTTDFEGLARPAGAAYDAGAYERGALSVVLYWTHPSFYGANNGQLVAVPMAGTAPYTYMWADGPTTATRNNLIPGTYTVTVRDAANVTRVRSFTLLQPDALTVTAQTWPKRGNTNNGQIRIQPHGGYRSYTIDWHDLTPTQETALADKQSRYNLAPGYYGVTVTDSEGISFTAYPHVRDAGTPLIRVNCGQIEIADPFYSAVPWSEDRKSLTSPPASPYFVMPGSSLPLQGETGGGNGKWGGINPTEAVSNIFSSWRTAAGINLSYAIPISNGTYEVQLYFIERALTPVALGQRVFDVQIEGSTRLDDFDAVAANGYGPVQRNFTVSVSDGTLNIDLIRGIGDVMISGIAVHTSATAAVYTILTPAAVGSATGSMSCPASGAFNEQPTWNVSMQQPNGVSAIPNQNTSTAYANRTWYIDLGPDWYKLRIVQMWTRYKPASPGSFTGFGTMWWDNDNNNINDGLTASGLNFSTAQNLPNSSSQLWVRDRNFAGADVIPQGRYLIVNTGATPTDRNNEFAFVGYFVP